VAEFNPDPTTFLARQRGNLESLNWRREGMRTLFAIY
jgi:hypothetical protein